MCGEGNDDGQSVICCFGTLVNLDCKTSRNNDSYRGRIEFGQGEKDDLREATTNNLWRPLGIRAQKILEALQKDLEIHLYAEDFTPAAKVITSVQKHGQIAKIEKSGPKASLSAVLYGPEDLFENVGDFAARCGFYLQPPIHCERDVPYRNPHCLTPIEGDISTFRIMQMHNLEAQPQENYLNLIDLFEDFEDCDALPETSPPDSVSTELYQHQKQALTFMLQREAGWELTSSRQDVWKKETDHRGEHQYINMITGSQQRREPPSFKGGLLIDAPGLGKTLSVLSLVATDIELAETAEAELSASNNTLLVVPKSLIHVWKNEITKHFHPSRAIKQVLYYGKDRTSQLRKMGVNYLVITTYSVVRLDWKTTKQEDMAVPNLFRHKWRRLVLDEAHIIREPSKTLARSVCDLDAEMRWVVTGTPIQNRLRDLFSLFKFLRCHPFDSRESFAAHVTQSWKDKDPTSIGKLKLLINCLSLRRPKSTIELPPYHNQDRRLDFSLQEGRDHDQIKSQSKAKLASINAAVSSVKFVNALQWINELRLMCNHGPRSSQEIESSPAYHSQAAAQDNFDRLEQSGLATCSNSACDQDLSSVLANEEDQAHDDDPWISESFMIYCCTCHANSSEKSVRVCNHIPRHIRQSKNEKEKSKAQIRNVGEDVVLPTKLQALIRDLLGTPPGIKSVVFSSWTRTFDILKPNLTNNSIRSLRLDGSQSATERANVLRVFHENPDVTVLLTTISCGGVGLDLTAASRVYIMEPQWNPMSESQALDRVYRLGQTKEVNTVRYIMRDSFEEQVLKLQNKKKELADLTINRRKLSKEEVSASRLAWLRDLVG